MAEFGTAVAVTAAWYHLLRSTDNSRHERAHEILAGIFIGFGLLWKVSFPLFVAGPFCYVLARKLGSIRRPDWRRALVSVLLMVLTAFVIAGPFYVMRIRPLLEFVAYNSSPSPSLEPFTLGPLFSPATVLKYWLTLVNLGASAYFFLLFIGLTVARALLKRHPIPLQYRTYFFACAIPPFLVLSLHQLKEPRHLFPVFALFAIALAAMCSRSRSHSVQ
jgi:hypothetical protein